MAHARPKFTKSLPTVNDLGAVYFSFSINLDNPTPLQGTKFVSFISNDLGLSATATVNEKGWNVLFTDKVNNWLRILTVYAYAEIYVKACRMANVKTTEVGVDAFIENASKVIQITFEKNKIFMKACAEDCTVLMKSVKSSAPSCAARQDEDVLQEKSIPPAIAQNIPSQSIRQPAVIHARATQHKAPPHKHMQVRDDIPRLKALKNLRLG